ncbi:MAG: hypothetical protein J5I50_13590 [Chitinophagaceae bacterium]|nr:hypothetical protein [Chitinophagaceae bacterium]
MNPITWVIASTAGYNAYSFTMETLLYIFIGGLGMYKLTSFWGIRRNIGIIAGVALMCSGYMTGHLQHINWLSGAAFLPWCLLLLLRYLKSPSPKRGIATIILFYLLISSSHPGIIIGAFYFFAGILFFQLFNKGKSSFCIRLDKRKILSFIILLSGVLLLSAGLIAGYSDIIPQFTRGESGSFADSPAHTTSIQSWISLLLPMAVAKKEVFFKSDLSLRNSYMGLVLLTFLIIALFGKKTAWQKYLLWSGFFFVLISLGGPIKGVIQKVFPLVDYVRLSGEFRIFAILSFILTGAIEAEKYFSNSTTPALIKRRAIQLLFGITALIVLCAAVKLLYGKDSILFMINDGGISGGSLPLRLKYLIDHLSLYDCILIHGCIQALLLWFIYRSLKSRNSRKLMITGCIDLIIASLLIIPFTGAGKTSPTKVQSVIAQSPAGIPIPPLHPIRDNSDISNKERELILSWSMYNKEIGTVQEVPYPIRLKHSAELFQEDTLLLDSAYFSKPFIYLKHSGGSFPIRIVSFAPGRIVVNIRTKVIDTLVLQQNFYPYWRATVNDSPATIIREGPAFMSVPVPAKDSNIIFSFEPAGITRALGFSLAFLIILLIALSVLFFRKSSGKPN